MLGFSCSKKTDIENQIQPNQENFVSMDMVVDIAYNIKFPNMKKGSSLKSANKKTKEVKKIDEVKNKNEVTAFYVVNYNEGGFLLISSDFRTSPIIGFSEKGSFDMDEANMPDGLRFWIKDAKKQFFEIQKSDIKPSAKEKIAWKLVKESLISDVSSLKNIPIDNCYDHTEVVTKGPLSTSSAWNQGANFNYFLPLITYEGINRHAYAGCVPIAMGQIMDYYEYPNLINWAYIPTEKIPTSSLISDIWYNINEMYPGIPQYDCSATYVDASMIGPVLKDKYGFTSASYADYNSQTVKSNLWYNKPVILGALDQGGQGGHAWFCDGYKTVGYYWDDCTGIEYLYFYMKWGLYGDYDGWFGYDQFNPGIFNFTENKKMIYNIYP